MATRYALMANADPTSDRYKQLGPYVFVRQFFDTMPELHEGLEEDIRPVQDDAAQENWIWNYNGSGKLEPPPPPPTTMPNSSPMMLSANFLKSLTSEEYAALVIKADDALRAQKPDATLQRFLDLMRLEQIVRLDDDTNRAKHAMVKAHVLTQHRADELFKP